MFVGEPKVHMPFAPGAGGDVAHTIMGGGPSPMVGSDWDGVVSGSFRNRGEPNTKCQESAKRAADCQFG